jgi:outer membrane cobalamin receptor
LNKKVYFTFTGRGRIYEGNFPFEYRNGFTEIEEVRQNNALKDLISTASLTWKINGNNTLSVKGNYFHSDKELAGAVVFYNANNKQYLTNQELTGTLYHRYHKNRVSLFTEFTTQQSQLTYLDSNYLNAQGYLEQTYRTLYLNGQSQLAYQYTEKLKVSVGSEYTSEEILSGTISGNPHRTVLNQFIATEFHTKRQKLDLQTGFQYVDNQSVLSRRKNWNYLPALQYLFRFTKNIEAGFIARYTVRQPTFSELYYQRIGNTDLEPEEAVILSLPVKFNTKIQKWYNSFRIEPFYTYNTNKILAIPTKNLFVWSIQNIGKSQSTGIEIYDESRIQIGKGFLGQTASFTYQNAIDLSDPSSSVYRNQLTYIPFTSGSVELDWSVKNWSVYSLFMFQGYRYALQENIPSNIVDGYYTIDVGGSMKFDFKNQQLKLNVSLKNITNRYNQYIRYFVLPGFNYQLKLTYAI